MDPYNPIHMGLALVIGLSIYSLFWWLRNLLRTHLLKKSMGALGINEDSGNIEGFQVSLQKLELKIRAPRTFPGNLEIIPAIPIMGNNMSMKARFKLDFQTRTAYKLSFKYKTERHLTGAPDFDKHFNLCGDQMVVDLVDHHVRDLIRAISGHIVYIGKGDIKLRKVQNPEIIQTALELMHHLNEYTQKAQNAA